MRDEDLDDASIAYWTSYGNTIVVTRHVALVEFLRECRVIDSNTPILSHATSDDVRGKNVIGVLPMHLAALCKTVVEIPLNIPPELRGKELTLEQVRQYAGNAVVYAVTIVT